jgi:hypothetical protein
VTRWCDALNFVRRHDYPLEVLAVMRTSPISSSACLTALFSGSTPEACIQAMEEVLGGIGDSCPEC